jgi:large subunit ribosomal protein L7/L12
LPGVSINKANCASDGHLEEKGNPMKERIWSVEIKAIGDRLAALTVANAAALGEYLEQVHGVRVAAVAPVVRPDHIIDVDPTPPPPTAFQVVLEGFDPARKIRVIRVVRELAGLGLKEAKDLVEGAPKVFKEGLSKEEADKLKAALETAGAKVSVQGMK